MAEIITPIKKSKKKKARARTNEERTRRLVEVARLRFLKKVPEEEIAQKFNLSRRQIERDIRLIKTRMRKTAGRRLAHIIDDISEELFLSFEERLKKLWLELARLEGYAADLKLNEDQKKTWDFKTRDARLGIIGQIAEAESFFIDQLKKLGIVGANDSDKGGPINIWNNIGQPGHDDYAQLPPDEKVKLLNQKINLINSGNGSSANRLLPRDGHA